MADITVTPANVQPTTTTLYRTMTAGGTITAGMVLYENSSGNAVAAQANSATTDDIVGVALGGASSGQKVTVAIGGDINPGGTAVVGMVYCLSAGAAGGIAPYADLVSTNYVSFLGVGTTASNIKLGILNGGIAKP